MLLLLFLYHVFAVLIIFLFLLGYTVLGLAFWGLLEAYLATDQDFEVLYVFAGMMPVAMCVLACVVAAGNRARARREAEEYVKNTLEPAPRAELNQCHTSSRCCFFRVETCNYGDTAC